MPQARDSGTAEQGRSSTPPRQQQTERAVGDLLARYEDELPEEIDLSVCLLEVVRLTKAMVRLYSDLVARLNAEAGSVGENAADGIWERSPVEHQSLVVPESQGGMATHPIE